MNEKLYPPYLIEWENNAADNTEMRGTNELCPELVFNTNNQWNVFEVATMLNGRHLEVYHFQPDEGHHAIEWCEGVLLGFAMAKGLVPSWLAREGKSHTDVMRQVAERTSNG